MTSSCNVSTDFLVFLGLSGITSSVGLSSFGLTSSVGSSADSRLKVGSMGGRSKLGKGEMGFEGDCRSNRSFAHGSGEGCREVPAECGKTRALWDGEALPGQATRLGFLE